MKYFKVWKSLVSCLVRVHCVYFRLHVMGLVSCLVRSHSVYLRLHIMGLVSCLVRVHVFIFG